VAATLRKYCEASSDGADRVVLVQFSQNFFRNEIDDVVERSKSWQTTKGQTT